MTINIFCAKYNMTTANICTQRGRGAIAETAFHKPDGTNVWHIKESHFERRAEFKKKVILFNQELYFKLTEVLSESELSRRIASIYGGSFRTYASFFQRDLFLSMDNLFLKHKVSKSHWSMFKYGHKLIREGLVL